jgi:hypothetical protein
MVTVAAHAPRAATPTRRRAARWTRGVASLDHLVSAREQHRGHFETKYLGRLQVDNELKLGRPQNRQIGRPLALKNAPAIDADLANEVRKVRSVAYQPASFDALTPGVDRRNPMVRRQRSEVYATAVEERIVTDQECIGALMPETRKGRIDLATRARGEDFGKPMGLQSD